MSLYEMLVAYERTRGFPNPVVSRTNILTFYQGLTGSAAFKARMMRRDWGDDWREKLDRASR
jgi:hypothetical protein